MQVTKDQEELTPFFNIIAQGIRNISFENKISIDMEESSDQPNINVDFDISYSHIKENFIEILLKTHVNATRNNANLLMLKIEYFGICRVENFEKEEIDRIAMTDVATLLFPFVRQVVAQITADCGMTPLLLQPVNFFELFAQADFRSIN